MLAGSPTPSAASCSTWCCMWLARAQQVDTKAYDDEACAYSYVERLSWPCTLLTKKCPSTTYRAGLFVSITTHLTTYVLHTGAHGQAAAPLDCMTLLSTAPEPSLVSRSQPLSNQNPINPALLKASSTFCTRVGEYTRWLDFVSFEYGVEEPRRTQSELSDLSE